ncbi:MAG TPA: hypothetical protein VND99_05790 [Candidatus Acidoferrales bacterium]|nr:hypothetical protein [Candidatus Acidoferrales bacterium]
MKKEITLAAITLLLAAAPAFAQSSHANNENRGNSEEAHTNHDTGSVKGIQSQNILATPTTKPDTDDVQVTPTTVPTISPTATISITPCAPDDNLKNHGKYVSCVAHLHEGGEEVSETAHSDIGKDNHHTTPTPSVSPSTSPEPSTAPSVSPTPSASVSPTPITTAMGQVDEGESPLGNIGALFNRFIKFLEQWI